MKSGTLSQAVEQAAIDKAQEELQSINRLQPVHKEQQTARVS
jgi:hypothetical protein